jgi:hypothetical protein
MKMPIFHLHTDAYKQREQARRREELRHECYAIEAAHHRYVFAEKLAQYAMREPRAFVQIDAFAGYGDLMGDQDGDTLTGGHTIELMRGSTVRLLIAPEADAADVARCLRKMTDWIKDDPGLLAKLAADERRKTPRGRDDDPSLVAKQPAWDSAKVSPTCNDDFPF